MPTRTARLAALGVLTLAASPALAHTGAGAAASFMDGFLHPLGGLDHVLAMVAVGLWAGVSGGRAVWSYPLAFLSFMVVGGLFGIADVGLPAVEIGIALSVVVLGAALAFGLKLPAAAGAALVAAFAVFHGHAHGAEMAAGADAAGYAVGFVAATALLHGIGIGLSPRAVSRLPLMATRAAGGAMALAGIGLLVL
ncbi:HupE/UreJ family protein [Chelatococcus daeguensis]|uniref:HupE/UreJ family protein n=1 Tax=Chelatococcus daeguensis TaxID=444444 RepID=UPI0007AC1962|nr:HupE/UreJ family protein [Chelatococcus daeguensis]KZE34367.1 urease accessory protein [Chelatococcus daeguensis]MBM3083201.1 HupE/UreJ family protein [Chelatococcus daeguensis]